VLYAEGAGLSAV